MKIGVIGIGMMGSTHLDAYSKMADVTVVAVADLIEDRREGRSVVAGNVKGQSQGGIDFSSFRKYTEGMDLIADPEIEVVDICLPTPLHVAYAIAALNAGKHVLTEKPFSRSSAEGQKLVDVAKQSKGKLMCAMCMRFWPGWTWLKDVVEQKTYGKVLGAQFRRVTNHPGGPFYTDGEACGGAILDLHVHDTDFIQYCFGKPTAVFSRGYAKETSHIDHVVTQYLYEDIPLVVAEGSWAMSSGFGFSMQYTVNFEKATAVFDLAADHVLTLIQDGEATGIPLPEGMGYDHEIRYFIDCIQQGVSPATVDPESAVTSVRIVEAEVRSIQTGAVVQL